MKKKIAILFLLICFFLVACGCSDVNFTREYNAKTGEITDSITISLDSDIIPQEKLVQLDTAINDDFSNYIQRVALIEGIDIKPEIDGYNYTLTTTFKNVDLMLTIYNNTDIGPFSFYIKYANQTWISSHSQFLYKHNPDTDKSILSVIKYRLAIDSNKTYYKKYYELMHGKQVEGDNINLENINITQTFITDYDRLYSNANSVEVKDGKIIHTWNLNDKNADYHLIIYKLIARTSGWYIVALILALLLVIVLIIVVKIRKKPVSIEINNDKKITIK